MDLSNEVGARRCLEGISTIRGVSLEGDRHSTLPYGPDSPEVILNNHSTNPSRAKYSVFYSPFTGRLSAGRASGLFSAKAALTSEVILMGLIDSSLVKAC